MRPLWKDIFAAVWLGVILPGIVLNAFVWKERYRANGLENSSVIQKVPDSGLSIPIVDPDGTKTCMEMDAYLTGVLLAEMPAQLHMEA